MKQILSHNDRSHLEKRIAEAENLTKSQIVLATVKRCDNYMEIPWKAFAFSASVAALVVFLLNLLLPVWQSNLVILFSIVAILAAGAFFALLTVKFHGVARLFLSGSRAETETRQYAESLFLEKELFATSERTGILLLVSQFERQVIILPDKGLRDRLSKDAMKNIITRMSQPLVRKEMRRAFETGLDGLINILEPSATAGEIKDELSNKIIERKGE
jgi:putative membrane protein